LTTTTGRSRSCRCGWRRSTAGPPRSETSRPEPAGPEHAGPNQEDAIITGDHDGTAESIGGWLSSLIGELLGVDGRQIPTDRPLGELGIDSLTAAEFSVEVEERTGVNVPLERFLGDKTLTDLVRELESGAAVAGGGGAEVARA
jgi:acyl carrier protein